jgi:hypothetical protein
MKKTLVFLVLFLSLPCLAWGTAYYWVNGSGTWSDAANHWAATSGGSPVAADTPTTTIDAVFDSESNHSGGDAAYTVTVTTGAASNCKNLSFTRSGDPATGGLPTFTVNNSVTFGLYGDATFVAGMTVNTPSSGNISCYSTGAQAVATNGVTLSLSFYHQFYTTATLNLSDNFSIGTLPLGISRGTFNTNSHTITSGNVNFSGSNSRTLTLGSSTWNCSGNFDASGTGQTVTANTATINMTGSGKTWDGGSQTWGGVVNVSIGATALTILGANTVGFGLSPDSKIKFPASLTQNIHTWTGSGTSGHLVTITSSVAGYAATLNFTGAGKVNVDYYSIKDSAATPASTWYAGPLTHSTDVSGNSGWTFTAAPSGPSLPVILNIYRRMRD